MISLSLFLFSIFPWVKKILKKISVKKEKKFGLKTICVQMKILGTKIILGPKEFMGSKKFLGPKQVFGYKKFFKPKKYWVQKNLC